MRKLNHYPLGKVSREGEAMEEKVYLFLADGFEEIEGLTVVDILRRGKVDIQTVSVEGRKRIEGSHGICLEADLVLEEADLKDGVMYVLPGGMPGTLHLGECRALTDLLLEANAAGKQIAAICAAPSVLGDLGILEGREAVCYPGFEDRLKGAKIGGTNVVVSENVITSRGMGTAIPFALTLLSLLKDKETADAVGEGIIYGKL